MKYTIVVDSVAAIPESILKTRPIKVLPIVIDIDGTVQRDDLSEQELIDIYQGDTLSVKSVIKSLPPSSEQIRDMILTEIAPYSDYAVCQSLSRVTSSIYETTEKVASGISKDARDVRNELGIEHPFRMTALNTGTTLAGQGLVAIYSDIMLGRGTEIQEYSNKIEKFTKLVKTYVIVKDLVYSRQRAIEKGVKTVGLGTALIGKTVGLTPIVEICNDVTTPVAKTLGFDKTLDKLITFITEQIIEGLLVPVINISYAGDLDDIHTLSVTDKLKEVAKKHKVKLLFGVMGLGSSTVYGPGAFSVGIVPKNRQAQP